MSIPIGLEQKRLNATTQELLQKSHLYISGCRRGWYGKNCKHRCYCPKHHTCSRITGECHCRHRRCMVAANPSIRGSTGRVGVPHVHVQGETGMYYYSKYLQLKDKVDVLIVRESLMFVKQSYITI